MHKKIISLLLTATMVFSSITMVHAESKTYLALGDDIPYGCGLDDYSKCYPELFAAKESFTIYNMSEKGLTSKELLENIMNKEYPIEDADVITISIGSNDLIQPILELIASKLGIIPEESDNIYSDILEMVNLIYADGEGIDELSSIYLPLSKTLTNNSELLSIADEYANETLPSIIDFIQRRNPDAEIYITNIYNPYYKVVLNAKMSANSTASASVDLEDICQPYIDEINEAFSEPNGYTLVDIADYFTTRVLTNATRNIWVDDILNCNIEPYPDTSGHAVIAYALANAYEANQTDILYGDTNQDGVIEASDAALTLQYVLNPSAVNVTATGVAASDVDGSGAIDASDAASILQKTLNASYQFKINS